MACIALKRREANNALGGRRFRGLRIPGPFSVSLPEVGFEGQELEMKKTKAEEIRAADLPLRLHRDKFATGSRDFGRDPVDFDGVTRRFSTESRGFSRDPVVFHWIP